MDEKAWQLAEWTDPFVDIEGDLKPKPFYNTQVKMLYDDEFSIFMLILKIKISGQHLQREMLLFFMIMTLRFLLIQTVIHMTIMSWNLTHSIQFGTY